MKVKSDKLLKVVLYDVSNNVINRFMRGAAGVPWYLRDENLHIIDLR